MASLADDLLLLQQRLRQALDEKAASGAISPSDKARFGSVVDRLDINRAAALRADAAERSALPETRAQSMGLIGPPSGSADVRYGREPGTVDADIEEWHDRATRDPVTGGKYDPADYGPVAGRIASGAGSFVQGGTDILAGLPKSAAIGWGALTGERPEQLGAYKWGQSISDFAAGNFPASPKYADEFITADLTRGAGSALGFLGAGLAGRALSLGKMGATAIAGVAGAATGATAQYEEAKAAGAPDSTAFWAALGGAGTGSLEALPVMGLLNKTPLSMSLVAKIGLLNKRTGGRVVSALVKSLAGGVDDGVQELVQSIGDDLIAKGLYDESREILRAQNVREGAAGYIIGLSMYAIPEARRAYMRHQRIKKMQGETPASQVVDATGLSQAAARAAVSPSRVPAEDDIRGPLPIATPGTAGLPVNEPRGIPLAAPPAESGITPRQSLPPISGALTLDENGEFLLAPPEQAAPGRPVTGDRAFQAWASSLPVEDKAQVIESLRRERDEAIAAGDDEVASEAAGLLTRLEMPGLIDELGGQMFPSETETAFERAVEPAAVTPTRTATPLREGPVGDRVGLPGETLPVPGGETLPLGGASRPPGDTLHLGEPVTTEPEPAGTGPAVQDLPTIATAQRSGVPGAGAEPGERIGARGDPERRGYILSRGAYSLLNFDKAVKAGASPNVKNFLVDSFHEFGPEVMHFVAAGLEERGALGKMRPDGLYPVFEAAFAEILDQHLAESKPPLKNVPPPDSTGVRYSPATTIGKPGGLTRQDAAAVVGGIRRVLGDRVAVTFLDSLVAREGETEAQAAHGVKPGAPLRGRYAAGVRAIIEIATNQSPQSVRRTGWHEAMHAIVDPANGFLTSQEVGLLMERYGTEEAAADGFADFMMGRPEVKPPGVIARIWAKLKALLGKLTGALNAEGIASVDELFETAARGGLAGRSADAGPPAGTSYQVIAGAPEVGSKHRVYTGGGRFLEETVTSVEEDADGKTWVHTERVRSTGETQAKRRSMESWRKAAAPRGSQSAPKTMEYLNDPDPVTTTLTEEGHDPEAIPPGPPKTALERRDWALATGYEEGGKNRFWTWYLAPMAKYVWNMSPSARFLAGFGFQVDRARTQRAGSFIADWSATTRQLGAKPDRVFNRLFGMYREGLDPRQKIEEKQAAIRQATGVEKSVLVKELAYWSDIEAKYGDRMRARSEFENALVDVWGKHDDGAKAEFDAVAPENKTGHIQNHWPHMLNLAGQRQMQAGGEAYQVIRERLAARVAAGEKISVEEARAKVSAELASGRFAGASPFVATFAPFQKHRAGIIPDYLVDWSISVAEGYFEHAATQIVAHQAFYGTPGAANPSVDSGIDHWKGRVQAEVARPGDDEKLTEYLRMILRTDRLSASQTQWAKFFRGLAGVNYGTKLFGPMQTVRNSTNMFTLGMIHGGPANVARSIADLFSLEANPVETAPGVFENLTERERNLKAGVTSGALVEEKFEHPGTGSSAPEIIGGAIARWGTKWSGFAWTERLGRMAAGTAGYRFSLVLVDAIRRDGNLGPVGRLFSGLGSYSPKTARRLLRKLYRLSDVQVERGIELGKWDWETEKHVRAEAAASVQFRGGPNWLPGAFAKNTAAMIFFRQFKGFMYTMTRSVKEQVIDEAVKGNVRPAVAFLIGAGLAGEAVQLVASLFDDREKEADLGVLAGKQLKSFKARLGARFLENVTQVGALGFLENPGQLFTFDFWGGVNLKSLNNSRLFIQRVIQRDADLNVAVHEGVRLLASEVAMARILLKNAPENRTAGQALYDHARTASYIWNDIEDGKTKNFVWSAVSRLERKYSVGSPWYTEAEKARKAILDGDLDSIFSLREDAILSIMKAEGLSRKDAAQRFKQVLLARAPLAQVGASMDKLAPFIRWAEENRREGPFQQAPRDDGPQEWLRQHLRYRAMVDALFGAYR